MQQPLATRLVGRIASVEELLGLVEPPLAAIGETLHRSEAYAAPVELLRESEWAAVQLALLSNTLVTWASALDDRVLDGLLRGWFAPTQPAGAFVWRHTLATLSLVLSKTPHEETKRLVERILSRLDPRDMVEKVLSTPNAVPSRRDMDWRACVTQLVALPVRVANVWETAAPHVLDQDVFLGGLARSVDALLPRYPAQLAVLVARMASSGYVARDTRGPSFWGSLVPVMLSKIENGSYARAWRTMWNELPQSAQETLAYSLCAYLDTRLDAAGFAWPVGSGEHAPGAEGRAFLSADAAQAVHAACALMDLVVSDASGATKADLLRLLPTCVPPWTPLMGACIAKWTVTVDDAAEIVPIFVSIWGDQTRCRRASRKEEQFLAVLLASCMKSDAAVLKSVSLSQPFLAGVSAHLESVDGGIRRLGMLVAELLSAACGQALAFPASVWDGRGDLKEASRVIRAYAALQSPDPDPACWARVLDIRQEKEAPPAPTPKPRSEPVTRILPVRIAPKAPPKPSLIQVIEPDEPEELDGFKTYAHSDSEPEFGTSGDEDEDEDDGRDAQNIAADLAGVDSSALNKVPDTDTLDKAFHKKQRPPVYIGELPPLLREQDFKANRTGLKHAEALIRRKTGWGSEIHENAVDLCMALCSIQNTFAMRSFDEMRRGALVALCVAAPVPVGDCLAEQFFSQHYSLPQRFAMMHALAAAAHELAGLAPLNDASDTQAHALGLAEKATPRAAQKAAGARSIVFAPPDALTPQKAYLSIATSAFVMPLLNRFHVYVDARRTLGYRRAGQDTALSADAQSAALHTLSILCSSARNALGFHLNIIPDALALAEAVCARSARDDVQVHAAALALTLVVLDCAWARDRGIVLVRAHASLLIRLRDIAQHVMQGDSAGNDSDSAMGEASPRARAVRAAAGVLVRLSEMEREAQDALLGTGTL
ncbi:telomere binding protein [Malassezia cuniculi]|uniref:Telomere binding protein n=1 Tax=Malassezia cuniculi TaxID=948313 RepID=A0AAF0F0N0_9BASI|nr:telomere binding protein [Malassezia cuniculi]